MAENKNQARAGGPGHGPGRGHGYQRPQNLRGTVCLLYTSPSPRD